MFSSSIPDQFFDENKSHTRFWHCGSPSSTLNCQCACGGFTHFCHNHFDWLKTFFHPIKTVLTRDWDKDSPVTPHIQLVTHMLPCQSAINASLSAQHRLKNKLSGCLQIMFQQILLHVELQWILQSSNTVSKLLYKWWMLSTRLWSRFG